MFEIVYAVLVPIENNILSRTRSIDLQVCVQPWITYSLMLLIALGLKTLNSLKKKISRRHGLMTRKKQLNSFSVSNNSTQF